MAGLCRITTHPARLTLRRKVTMKALSAFDPSNPKQARAAIQVTKPGRCLGDATPLT
jgi:hypothetical protein